MPDRMDLLWSKLETPASEQGLAAIKIKGTNCWITKNAQDALGFVMVGVHEPTAPPRLTNIEFQYFGIKQLYHGGEITNLSKCLEVSLDSSCDPRLLMTVFDRMSEFEPSGKYTSDLMITILEEVIKLVRRPPNLPSREEVVGAWGELYVLKSLLESTPADRSWRGIISGWEAQGKSRDIIDFRLHHLRGGTAIEVKTSSSGWLHHIRGMNQITKPEGFSQGLLASLRTRFVDDGAGKTCIQLVEDIKFLVAEESPEAPELLALLEGRIERRGISCIDDRYEILLVDDVRWISMVDVPKPVYSPLITQVEWVADVSDVSFTQSLTELIAGVERF